MGEHIEKFLNKLKAKALINGATDATIIDATIIPVEDKIVEYCTEPLCASYGKNANCPPYAIKPVEARKLIIRFQRAILYSIPNGVLAGLVLIGV